MDRPGKSNPVLLICLGLVIGTLALYARVLSHEFITYDDLTYVVDNPHVRGGITPDSVAWAFSAGRASNWHPLTWISHALDCQIFGLNPGGHHATSVLLHTLNAVLLFLILRRITGVLWRPAIVAALFAWHPLHVESVAWVAERKDVLSAFFWLMTILAYIGYAESSADEVPLRKFCYGLTLVLFAFGLMSKPMVITLPFVLLLLDYWPLGRREPGGKQVPVRLLLIEKVPLFALCLGSALVTYLVQVRGGSVTALAAVPLGERVTNALVSWVRYAGKLIWPADLAVYYPPQAWALWQWAGAGLLLLLISGAVMALCRRQPWLVTGWFWFVGTLVPVIGIVQVGSQAMADRYSYLPSVGAFIALAWAGGAMVEWWPRGRTALGALAVAVLAGYAAVTEIQLGYWKSSTTLFNHALAVTRDNPVARANLGLALANAGNFDAGMEQLQRALKLEPGSTTTLCMIAQNYARRHDYANAIASYSAALRGHAGTSSDYFNFGNALFAAGRLPEAAAQYHEAARLEPDAADVHQNFGATLLQLGRLPEAVDEFQAALRANPDFAEAQFLLGVTTEKLGHPDRAVVHFQEALRLKPDFARARLALGIALGHEGRAAQAAGVFQEIITREPGNAEAHFNLAAIYSAHTNLAGAAQEFAIAAQLKPGDADFQRRLASALGQLGDAAEAIPHYREALRLRPDWPEAMSDLAWLLATSRQDALRNGTEAVSLAERALALAKQPNPRILSSLDAAYAEAGRFADAIRVARQIQQLPASPDQKMFAGFAAQRIESYTAGKPFRN